MSHSGYCDTEWKNMAQSILKFNFTNLYNCKGKIKCVHKHDELGTFTRTVNKCGPQQQY